MKTVANRPAVVRAVAVALVLGVFSAGVGTTDDQQAEPKRHGTTTSGGSFYVEWWTEPEPIPLNEVFMIRFRVTEPNASNKAIADAVVVADAWMPEHNHGTTLTPRIESHGDGTATGHGFLLHMEGHWQLRVGVAVGGQMERATFDLDIEP